MIAAITVFLLILWAGVPEEEGRLPGLLQGLEGLRSGLWKPGGGVLAG